MHLRVSGEQSLAERTRLVVLVQREMRASAARQRFRIVLVELLAYENENDNETKNKNQVLQKKTAIEACASASNVLDCPVLYM